MNGHADSERRLSLFRSRVRSRLRAWGDPRAFDRPDGRCEDGRIDGDATHVRGDPSRGAMGGSAILFAAPTDYTAWRRVRRAGLFASSGIHGRSRATGFDDRRVL